ncbi:hypothetical protein [Hymenobacter nivis]|uniref:hypothetical protein n=1 Tax=Hymenobacter nivis TaxID=1850093 RepID=UPI001375A4B7|nr:hypothetical protein [Hymenobacter nivis]
MTSADPGGRAGTYNFDENGVPSRAGFISMFKQVDLTPEIARQFRVVVEEAKTGNASLAEFTEKTTAISPELGRTINTFFQENQYSMAALSILIAVLTYLYTVLGNSQPTVINNTYNVFPAVSLKPQTEISREQKRGNNLTPPLTKKQRAKKRRK